QCFPEGTDMTSVLDLYFQVRPTLRTPFPSVCVNSACSGFKLESSLSPCSCPPAVLHRGDVRERQRHGRHPGQRRLLSNQRRACAEPRGGEEHLEPHALLRHVRLLRTVCLPRKSERRQEFTVFSRVHSHAFFP
ncbi:unnamed protein product, partial [Tetraodon nigroviridis]